MLVFVHHTNGTVENAEAMCLHTYFIMREVGQRIFFSAIGINGQCFQDVKIFDISLVSLY